MSKFRMLWPDAAVERSRCGDNFRAARGFGATDPPWNPDHSARLPPEIRQEITRLSLLRHSSGYRLMQSIDKYAA